MKKTFIVAKREYTKVIRKPTFWLSTLFFPVFLVIVSFVSGFSATQSEAKIKESLNNVSSILIYDQTSYINKDIISKPYEFIDNLDTGLSKIKNGSSEGLIFYPRNLDVDKKIEIYQQDKGILASNRFADVATNLLKQSILINVNDTKKIAAFNNTYSTEIKSYVEGKEIKVGIESLIVPGASLMLFVILTTFATSYLLMSVSEEKENRIIEIVLSAITPRELITGKIFGQVLIVITQVLILLGLSIGALIALNNNVLSGVDFSNIQITPLQIIAAIFYTLMGFFILACTMVGVGAAMPSYREAQSFSSIFIILAIFPVYFITLILAEPNGTISMIISYFPFTAGLVLLLRNAIGAVPPIEMIISVMVLLLYGYIAINIAFRLFEFGSLEYNRKISFKGFISSLKNNKGKQ